jgi:hypothetical protein
MEQMYQEMKKYLVPQGTMIWSTTTPVPLDEGRTLLFALSFPPLQGLSISI